jgi:Zn-dependent protease with chaperone function
MAQSKSRKLRTFPGLDASTFQHPSDVAATDALRKVPGLDAVVAKIMEYGFERVYYLENVANNVRVTSKMFPRLYKNLQWACKILDVEEPELYVTMSDTANAYTYGHTKPFIVMTSSLVELLDDEERFFVLAHELGHIKADHTLYTMMARNIAQLVALLGQVTLGIGNLVGQGLVLALYEWSRKAELTADRAGLICVQDLAPCTRTFMKLAGGARKLWEEMDEGEFVRQIRAYEAADTSTLNKAYKILLTATRSHPFPILRAKELDAWHGTGYRELTGPRGLLGPGR